MEITSDSQSQALYPERESEKLWAQSLGQRTLRSTAWLLLGKFYRQILFLVTAAVLGHLLGPRDFGLVGLGALALQLLGIITYTGFGEALVQRPNLTPRIIHTVWWVMCGRAVVIALALGCAAPLVAAWFNEPEATAVLWALAGVQCLSGFSSIGVILLIKEMNFKALFKWEAWGQTMDLVVAIIAALIWRNVWALVLGSFAGAFTRVLLSYLIYPYRPQWVFDLQAARELFKFGQWLLFAASLYFLLSKGTDMVSGFLFGAAALGLYQMASRFALLPTYHFGEVFLHALFPAYSLIQDDPEKLKGSFLKVLQVATFVIFPLSTLMAVAVPPLLPLLLGAKWQGVVTLMPGLALGGAIQALLRTGPPLFMATGKPRGQFFMDLACSAGIFLGIYPLCRFFGLEGLTWSYAGGMFWGIPLWWRFVRQQSTASSRELAISILPAMLASLLLAAAIWLPGKLFHLPLPPGGSVVWLTLFAILGSVLYLLLILWTERLLAPYRPLGAALSLIQNSWQKRNSNG